MHILTYINIEFMKSHKTTCIMFNACTDLYLSKQPSASKEEVASLSATQLRDKLLEVNPLNVVGTLLLHYDDYQPGHASPMLMARQ